MSKFRVVVLATVFVAFLVVAAGLANKALAGKADVDTIDEYINDAIGAYQTDDDAYEEALDNIVSAYLDPFTPNACRVWLDNVLLAMLIIEQQERFPATYNGNAVLDAIASYVPIARNDCLLAV